MVLIKYLLTTKNCLRQYYIHENYTKNLSHKKNVNKGI